MSEKEKTSIVALKEGSQTKVAAKTRAKAKAKTETETKTETEIDGQAGSGTTKPRRKNAKTNQSQPLSAVPVAPAVIAPVTGEGEFLLPMVSICTPTFNRRPFFSTIIQCFHHQVYPKDRLEWIIIDDGTDKVGDLVSSIPQVRYFAFDEKMTLGKKRNLMHEKAQGEYIVYMDDDDYYPPERVSHAVETLLKNPQALCAGSSVMHIYFKHIHEMYKFGPYGPNHSTAATFAFPRSLLSQTSYEEGACLAEEKHFLKNYTIPFVQLDPNKTILVFSHVHNTFDKKSLLETPNQFQKRVDLRVEDLVKEESIRRFFMEEIDDELSKYHHFGKVENKPDVLAQMADLKKKREEEAEKQKEANRQQLMSMNQVELASMYEQKLIQQAQQLQNCLMEIQQLRTQNQFLSGKMNEIIQKSIEERKRLLALSQKS